MKIFDFPLFRGLFFKSGPEKFSAIWGFPLFGVSAIGGLIFLYFREILPGPKNVSVIWEFPLFGGPLFGGSTVYGIFITNSKKY